MSLLKDLQGLNAAYAEMQQKEAYTVTAADKKGNTPAYQGLKAGKKNVKTGEPMYKAADHLKKEDRESKLWNEVAKMLTELHELRGVKYKVVLFNEDAQSDAVAQMSGDGGDPQDDAVKQVAGKKKKAKKDYDGDGKIESGKDEYFGSRDKAIKKAMGKKVKEEVSDETKKLIESGKFTQEEIESLKEAERSLSDRLARKRKVYDKTTKKAMDFARDEGEASGHARYRMSSISREMDGIKAKMNKK